MKATKALVLAGILLFTTNLILAQRDKDGSYIAPGGNTVVNTYAYLTSDAAVGASSLTVNNNAMTGGVFGGALAPGDLIMIIQMQGATIDINTWPTVGWGGNYTVPNIYFTTWGLNPHEFGQITNYNQSGVHERVEVLSVSGGNTINLNCNLTNSYTATGHVQIIRIPRFTDLTLNAGSAIEPSLWDGNVGGVVALEVNGNLTINAGGSISASGFGFRGGELDPTSLTATSDVSQLRHLGSFDNLEGSEKGEGIAGYHAEYIALSSRYGIGAAANGGGGGGYQNTGGGGGCNVMVGGGAYSGKGNPQGYAAVWDLETIGFGGSTSSGGGRGGYAYSNLDADATLVGPRNNLWGGDGRKTNGGFGGHPLAFVGNRVWLGGGGGAGDQDSGEGGAGGRGGGLVFMSIYGTISGSGTIESNGADGQNSNPTGVSANAGNPTVGNDGAGGGGAGGSIHIENISPFPGTMLLDVHGGDGGDQDLDFYNPGPPFPAQPIEAGGPGGSGSGGYIRISSGAPIKNLVAGANGTTNSPHLTEFPPNGATEGSDGFTSLPANPTFDIDLTDVTICSSASANLVATITGTPLGTVTWYNAMVGGTSVNTGNSYMTPALAVTTTYWVGVCPGSFREPVTVTVNPPDDASFNYASITYCLNDSDPTPVITGLAGGTFTSSPAGLTINAATGEIDVSASTPAAYTVTYTTNGPCPNSSNVAIIIAALDDATFNYASASYCNADPDPTPTITGLAGGTFTSAPAGLSINSSTGQVDVSTSTPAIYTVTYTTSGPCPTSSNVSVTISALDDATFNYGAVAYCIADPDPTPSITGTGGGTFSSAPGGLSINATTGQIDVSASTPAVYTVTYTTSGACSNSSNVPVTITALDDASFNYSNASYCLNAIDPTPTITGITGGGFTSAPAGLSINSSSGLIDVSASTPGLYTITYLTVGACANASSVAVTILALDDPSFNYVAASYCADASDPTPTITGLGGGAFTSLPVGLTISAVTGQVDVSASTPGAYTVTYTTVGPCPTTSNESITIVAIDDATFNFGSPSYCFSGADPTPTITGLGGGVFSSLPVGLSLNATTGQIDASASTPGAYTITYTTTGPCPSNSNVAVTITVLDDASFNYVSASYCVNDLDPAPSITGVLGGTFSSAPGGLSINATTGQVDVSASTPGVYAVTYLTVGACANSSNVSVTISALDDASFGYSAAAYCLNSTDPSAIITGLPGGSFSSAPVGLSIIAASGLIDVSASTPGVYMVTYTTSGACVNTSNVTVTIDALDDATFNYSAVSYCANALDQSPTMTGLAGGSFSIAPAVGLPINTIGGVLNVSGSTPGMYTVTYTSNGPCPTTSNETVTIDALDDASYSYSSASYCLNATDPLAAVTGLAGGVFSSAPAGLIMNSATGEIDLSASTPGSFTITYTTSGPCSNSSDVSVTIDPLDDATFNYGATSYCVNSIDPIPVITGLAGGTFASSPAGMVINTATGEIDVSSATPGLYSISYTTNGSCPNTSSVSVTIDPMDDATFSYSAPTYCVVDPDPNPIITGLIGGGFSSSPAGLVINAVTGVIDVSTSTVGVYSVAYTTVGACPNSMDVTVEVLAGDNVAFTTIPTCDGGTVTSPVTIGGTYSFAVAPTDGAVIDPVTGVVSGGTSGNTYSISYTTVGVCGASSTESVTALLSPVLDPIIDVSACDSYALLAITGTDLSGSQSFFNDSQANGGTAISGAITATQTVFVYDVNAGGCDDEFSFVVTITPSDDASFTVSNYCEGASNFASITGTAGGAFAFSPLVTDGATVDPLTGEVSDGIAGANYTIEYTTAGICPSSSTQTLTVITVPQAPFVSADETFCTNDILTDMNASGGSGVFSWFDDASLVNQIGSGSSQSPFSIDGTTSYYVYETENGCSGPVSIINITLEDCDVIIPTAFTPDGDGANDNWELMDIDNIYPDNLVKVYNRWGNLIFESVQGDYDNNRWDGTYKGQLLPIAAYYYVIEPNVDGVNEMTGSVSIILGN